MLYFIDPRTGLATIYHPKEKGDGEVAKDKS